MNMPTKADIDSLMVEESLMDCSNEERLAQCKMSVEEFHSLVRSASLICSGREFGIMEFAKIFYVLGWKVRDQFGK